MTNDKEKYAELIRSSSLFKIDKTTEHIAYKREAMKMVEYLYCYVLAINERKYIEFGYELVETARRCIANYKTEMGEFLPYFNSAWAKEYRKAFGKRQMEELRGGLHIVEEEQTLIRKYLRLVEKHHLNMSDDDCINVIAEAMGIDSEKVREIVADVHNTLVVRETYTNQDGEEISVFDYIEASFDIDANEDIIVLLNKIEKVFSVLQERQKPLLSDLLTSKILDVVLREEQYLNQAKQLSFFSEKVYNSFIHGKQLTAKEIAASYGISEQSVSRSFRRFVEKIKTALEEDW